MQYADIIVAILGVLLLAWAADSMTGRRGLGGAVLVSAVGGLCGWFLVVRVLARATMDDWTWVVWALGGATLALAAFHLFRSKR